MFLLLTAIGPSGHRWSLIRQFFSRISGGIGAVGATAQRGTDFTAEVECRHREEVPVTGMGCMGRNMAQCCAAPLQKLRDDEQNTYDMYNIMINYVHMRVVLQRFI